MLHISNINPLVLFNLIETLLLLMMFSLTAARAESNNANNSYLTQHVDTLTKLQARLLLRQCIAELRI